MTEDTYRGELNEPDTLHLYAYCKNNPINYVDPSGHDAIVLKSNFVSEKIGHLAVLIQDKGGWYYFSWGIKGYKSEFMDKKANSKKASKKGKTTYYKSVKNGKVYSDINSEFKRKKESGEYKKYIYIKGNFSSSHKYIKQVKSGKTLYKWYSLTRINCAWMAIQVLQQGSISYSRYKKLHALQYRKDYSPKYNKGREVVRTIVPNNDFSKIASAFNASIKNVNK